MLYCPKTNKSRGRWSGDTTAVLWLVHPKTNTSACGESETRSLLSSRERCANSRDRRVSFLYTKNEYVLIRAGPGYRARGRNHGFDKLTMTAIKSGSIWAVYVGCLSAATANAMAAERRQGSIPCVKVQKKIWHISKVCHIGEYLDELLLSV